jgi:hypothetical protein
MDNKIGSFDLETYSIAHNKENEIKIDNKNDKINN